MATFENIRKLSPFALGAFAIIFVGFMILQDSDIQGLISPGSDIKGAIVGEINGKKISYIDFENKVKEVVEAQRAQMKGKDAENIKENVIRDQVWENYVNEMLLQSKAEETGISLDAEVISDIVFNSPPEELRKPFTDSAGRFNRELYVKIVTNPETIVNYMGGDVNKIPADEKRKVIENFRNQLIGIEKNLVTQIAATHINTMIGTIAGVISPTYAKIKMLQEAQSADVSLMAFSTKDIDPSKVNVSDEDINKYYEEHKQYYKQKDVRKLKYVIFPLQPSAADSARANKKLGILTSELAKSEDMKVKDSLLTLKMNEFNAELIDYSFLSDVEPSDVSFIREAPKGSILGPIDYMNSKLFYKIDDRRESADPQVKISHILIPFGANKDSAKQQANDVLAKAKGGENFATLAQQFSTDQQSAQQGGDLGFFKKTGMIKPLADASFSANVGDIVGPVETQFGWHIVKIDDKKVEEIKYSKIAISFNITEDTKKTLKRQAIALKTEVEKGGNFDDLAKKNKYQVMETGFFTRFNKTLNSQYLTNLAFESKIGTVLDPKLVDNFGVILAYVSEERTAGITPLVDKKAEIKNILTRNKMLDMVKSQAESAYAKVKTTDNLLNASTIDPTLTCEKADSIRNTGMIPGRFANEFGLTSKIFGAELNKVSEPYRGENSYFIYQVTRRNNISDQEINTRLLDYVQRMSVQARQNSFETWLANAKSEIKYVDNRTKHYTEF